MQPTRVRVAADRRSSRGQTSIQGSRDSVRHRRADAMTNDIFSEGPPRSSVRDGQVAPVTCGTCGCRLEPVGPSGEEGWFHFGRMGGRDARGCRVTCVELEHDASGSASLAA
jgi:hypothetical protein